MDDRSQGGAGGPVHVSVMAEPIVGFLAPLDEPQARPLGEAGAVRWVADVTAGAGGHSAALLEATQHLHVLGLDQDPEILALARQRLAPFGDRALCVHARFSELAEVVNLHGLPAPVGILADLGASSLQLDRAERGFSLMADGPLDMRMDPRRARTAADIVNSWDEGDLSDLFYHEGGETRARRVARAVVEARRRAPFLRTSGLAEVVAVALGGREGRLHPATKVFQALRRAVNEEGEELSRLLEAAEELLPAGGRLAVISFHSGEDAMVKRFLRTGARDERWELPSKKALQPEAREVRDNRRARSARLRTALRTRPVGESVR